MTARDRKALYDLPPEEWTLEELAGELRDRYEPPTIPPCRLCGAPLTIEQAGGGQPTVYACMRRDIADHDERMEHYSRSEWLDYKRGGDPEVMELLRRHEELRRERRDRDENGTE